MRQDQIYNCERVDNVIPHVEFSIGFQIVDTFSFYSKKDRVKNIGKVRSRKRA